MQKLIVALALALVAPTVALADNAVSSTDVKDARLVPALRDGAFVGLKVYAIRLGGRFDQPQAPFHNGDLIEEVDGVAVTTDAGTHALYDKVVRGQADAVVTVRRSGKTMELASKAL